MNFQFNNLTFTTCNSSRITQQFQQSNFSVYLKKLKKPCILEERILPILEGIKKKPQI